MIAFPITPLKNQVFLEQNNTFDILYSATVFIYFNISHFLKDILLVTYSHDSCSYCTYDLLFIITLSADIWQDFYITISTAHAYN